MFIEGLNLLGEWLQQVRAVGSSSNQSCKLGGRLERMIEHEICLERKLGTANCLMERLTMIDDLGKASTLSFLQLAVSAWGWQWYQREAFMRSLMNFAWKSGEGWAYSCFWKALYCAFMSTMDSRGPTNWKHCMNFFGKLVIVIVAIFEGVF